MFWSTKMTFNPTFIKIFLNYKNSSLNVTLWKFNNQGPGPEKAGFRIGYGFWIFRIFGFGFGLRSEKFEIQIQTQTQKSKPKNPKILIESFKICTRERWLNFIMGKKMAF